MLVRDKPHQRLPHKEFGARLKALRTTRAWTQEGLAVRAGFGSVGLHMIRQYEQGRCLPTADRLHNLCIALGATTADLFGDHIVSQGDK